MIYQRGDIMVYKEYEPAVLERIQKIEVEMLKDFDDFCTQHQIDYFGIGGTLLGAVRHGGFIPWDDDIDIGMTREHYDKFLQVADDAYEGKYKLINYELDKKFPTMFTKWHLKGTVFRDGTAMASGYSAGIAIDVFCFDKVPDDDKKLRRNTMKAWILGKLFVLRKISTPVIFVQGIKGKLMKLIARMGNGVLYILHISPDFLFHQAEKAAKAYDGEETKRVLYIFDPTPYMNLVKFTDIYPTKFMQFENINIRVPNNTQAYLKACYGDDYMTLPPEDKRHNHPPVELDFGDEG